MAPVNEPSASRPVDFGAAWAELEPHLRRSLSAAPAHVVDDVLQETSIKLLRVWESIDHDRPALPLAVTIARNTLRDELRRMARHSHDELWDEARVRDDLDAVVSARLELARVGSELTRLTPGQRAALLTEVGGGTRSPDTPKVKMLRSRARARLRELVAQAGGFVVTGVARLRSSAAERAAAGAPEIGILAQAFLFAVVAVGSAGVVVDGPGPRPKVADAVVAAAGDVRPGAAKRDAMSLPEGVRGSSAASTRRTVTGVAPDVAGGGGTPPGSPGLPSPSVPPAKGGYHDDGYFGAEGYSAKGEVGHSMAGHDVAGRYESEWESPDCVQKLAEGQTPGQCEAPESPSAGAEVEVDGHRHRVETD